MVSENRSRRPEMLEIQFYTYLRRILMGFKKRVGQTRRNSLKKSSGFSTVFLLQEGAGPGEPKRTGGMRRGGRGLSLEASALYS